MLLYTHPFTSLRTLSSFLWYRVEMAGYLLPSCFARGVCVPETLALVRILKKSIDPCGEIPSKFFRIKRKVCDRILFEGD